MDDLREKHHLFLISQVLLHIPMFHFMVTFQKGLKTDDFVLVALLYKQLPLPDLKTWRKKMISKFHQPCSPEPESEKSVYTQFGELLSIALKAVE